MSIGNERKNDWPRTVCEDLVSFLQLVPKNKSFYLLQVLFIHWNSNLKQINCY